MSMGSATLLRIQNLHVSVDDAEVVKGVSLDIKEGEVHAIMGPNGSGKSSLVHALMGHPRYKVTKGSATFRGEDLLAVTPDERAKRGLFLAFQYPKEIAGVTLRSFLFAAYKNLHGAEKRLTPMQFQKMLLAEMETLTMDPAFAERSLNQGFSGGEKKKAEILQMKILRPRLALLDETDSGLDVDALRVVAQGVNAARSPDVSALIVTHYARILEYIAPDRVHVMVQGRIAESGGADFARALEREGYARYGEGVKGARVRLETE